ncbi:hypothetical protein MUP77_11825 [Candidatus Bathyarchaeota archaeon]|nr:hypothetical protein [Candidatus Bathyarchaeota archaeon]
MPYLKCMRCGYEWSPYKIETSLSWRQCPNPRCRSYSVIEVEKFDDIVNEVVLLRESYGRRVFPMLDSVKAVLFQRGLRLRPLQTLDLALAVEKEVIRRLERG